MNPEQRKKAFLKLGEHLNNLSEDEFEKIAHSAYIHNRWFTRENVALAINSIAGNLQNEQLDKWLENYDFSATEPKNVGIIAAGNIPLVCFHDVLCVLLAGHTLHIKMSKDDHKLPVFLLDQLTAIEPAFQDKIIYPEYVNTKTIDKIIATGSNNTARYFKYYFSTIPHIIRHNRTGIAVLTGEESEEDLRRLTFDIFSYFGLGCRNVTKLYIPQNYDLTPLLNNIEKEYAYLKDHAKYANNYDYHKALMLMNEDAYIDNEVVLLRNHPDLFNSVATLHYEYYNNLKDLSLQLEAKREHIQTVISKNNTYMQTIAPGQSQYPALWDYADQVDTMAFLM